MSEQRKITVQQNNPAWQEYDREVLIELWHNAYETMSLELSHEEARTLLEWLAHFLGAQGGAA